MPEETLRTPGVLDSVAVARIWISVDEQNHESGLVPHPT